MSRTVTRARTQLSPSTLFSMTQAHRPEQMYSLLYNFPSLHELGLDLPKLSNAAIQASSRVFQSVAQDLQKSSSRETTFGANHPVGAPAAPGFQVPLPEEGREEAEGAGGGPPGNGDGRERIEIDIRGWAVRDQGRRGTCVAHALVACREHLAFEQGESPEIFDLSEQFLFWATKTRDASPDQDGTWIEFAQDALEKIGVCPESFWPYDGTVWPGNLTQTGPGMPTDDAHAGARPHRHGCAEYGKGGGAARLLEILTRTRRPVAISVPVFRDRLAPRYNNWNSPVGEAYGVVLDPPPTAVVEGGHAVCVIGFVPDDEELQGGYFVIRNSWGTDAFGRRSPLEGWHAPAPGYGQISAHYIENYLWELCVL